MIAHAEMTGHKELTDKLYSLKRSVRNRIMRKAVRAVNKPIRNTAKSFAPRGETGALKRSMSSKLAKQRGDTVLGITGPRRRFSVVKKDGTEAKPTKYAKLVEHGTKKHRIVAQNTGALSFTLNGKRVAIDRIYDQHARPTRFMSRASAASASQARSAFTDKARQDLLTQAVKSKPSEADDGN